MTANEEYINRFAQMFGVENRNQLNDHAFIFNTLDDLNSLILNRNHLSNNQHTYSRNYNLEDTNYPNYNQDRYNINNSFQNYIIDHTNIERTREILSEDNEVFDMINNHTNHRNNNFYNSINNQAIIDRVREEIEEQIQHDNLDDELIASFEDSLDENIQTDTNLVSQTIKKLTLCTNKNPIDCSICLDKVESNVEIYKLKCKHVFHKSCLETWIKEKLSCPVCRKNI